jgi:hypothetical protein
MLKKVWPDREGVSMCSVRLYVIGLLGLGKHTPVNVPGRKIRVRKAIVSIEELSLLASSAIRAELLEIRRLSLVSS